MRYRKIDSNGDYTFGGSQNDFLINSSQCVGQACQASLQLWQGTFWRNLNAGLPMFQDILGQTGSDAAIQSITNLIQTQLANVQGVSEVISVDASFDQSTLEYVFTAQVQTIYSSTPLLVSFPLKGGGVTFNYLDFSNPSNSMYIPLR